MDMPDTMETAVKKTKPPKNKPPVSGSSRVVIDPVTRIEGHLRIEVEIRNGEVAAAWSSGMLFRGIETILKGRNPEDAWLFTQRLCGVCTYVHGSSSVRCVEDALGISVPANARTIRNLQMGAQFLHDHIVHFYHLHALDWIDIASAITASPVAAAALAKELSPNAPVIDFAAVQGRLKAFIAGGQLGIFAGAYWLHEAYLLGPEENLLLAAHYFEALKLQVKAGRMHAVFGGKNPHPQSLKVGGVTCRDDITSARIAEFRSLLQETQKFIDTVYVPDAVLLAQGYPEWAGLGGTGNFLAFGEFPQSTTEPASLYFPQDVIINRGGPAALNLMSISEHVKHSWYNGETARHPSSGETVPHFTGIDTANRYSWLKAPRYAGEPFEMGPLARVLVACKNSHSAVKTAVEGFLKSAALSFDQMYSTIGRTAARALESTVIAQAMGAWLNALQTGGSLQQSWSMKENTYGYGLNEAPRGALGQWIQIQNGTIGNYQMVIPSTWNFGPRCAADKPGPVESALVGSPVAEPARPVEVLRTVRSFDPCIACAVHIIDPKRDKVYTVRAS
jgi:[NiFe] hydrogenase large subunit